MASRLPVGCGCAWVGRGVIVFRARPTGPEFRQYFERLTARDIRELSEDDETDRSCLQGLPAPPLSD